MKYKKFSKESQVLHPVSCRQLPADGNLNWIWFSRGESDSFVSVVKNRVVISEENFADVPHWLTIGEGHVVGVECRYAYS